MRFDLKAPCNDCPFRREGHIALVPARVAEFADNMLSSAGKTFTCHKRAHNLGLPRSKQEAHCAGALIFAEKNENATQMMRIAERLGMYDARATMRSEVAKAQVFDTREEMVASHAKHPYNQPVEQPADEPKQKRKHS